MSELEAPQMLGVYTVHDTQQQLYTVQFLENPHLHSRDLITKIYMNPAVDVFCSSSVMGCFKMHRTTLIITTAGVAGPLSRSRVVTVSSTSRQKEKPESRSKARVSNTIARMKVAIGSLHLHEMV